MTIHREGYRILGFSAVGLLTVYFALLYIPGIPIIVKQVYVVFSVVIYLLILQFFRSPKRISPKDDNLIYSPADGKVVVIEETIEEEYFQEKRRMISIFMSPLNVHVNWLPISGKVAYQQYHPGKYLVAWHPKSSTENERNTLVLENERISILLRQIAGKVARRIVSYASPGLKGEQGGEFGFIKFGSRVDIFLPLDTEITVTIGQRVRGKETVLGRITKNS